MHRFDHPDSHELFFAYYHDDCFCDYKLLQEIAAITIVTTAVSIIRSTGTSIQHVVFTIIIVALWFYCVKIVGNKFELFEKGHD